MCVVSMIGDHYTQKWTPTITNTDFQLGPSRYEFDQLKREVLEMKELLKKAKAYDQKNNEPDCELAEKISVLKAVAKLVGVDLDEVFSSTKADA